MDETSGRAPLGDLGAMMARHARAGRVDWIGLRPARRAGLEQVESAWMSADGLGGDHARAGRRALTLIQEEHLPVIAALLCRDTIDPEELRRNIVVRGINLSALRRRDCRIGGAVVRIESPCPPCSRMEETLGPGGYSAMRGHGGYYAQVMLPGAVQQGDTVEPV